MLGHADLVIAVRDVEFALDSRPHGWFSWASTASRAAGPCAAPRGPGTLTTPEKLGFAHEDAPIADGSGQASRRSGACSSGDLSAGCQAPLQGAASQAVIEVFSPGFAVHGRVGEASMQVSALSQPSGECRLAGPVARSHAQSP